MGIVRIPLSSRKHPGLFAIIDEEDYPLVAGKSWHPQSCRHTTYARRNIYLGGGRNAKFRVERLHRVILGVPDGVLVDHINGDGLDNRRCNLRVATKAQNNQNRHHQPISSTGYIGVCSSEKEWGARISSGGKQCSLGTYTDIEVAARVYDKAARSLYGPDARVNFPGESDITNADEWRVFSRGDRISTCKLSEQDVIEIRRRYAAGGCSLRALAQEYGVGETTVASLTSGRSWRHLL